MSLLSFSPCDMQEEDILEVIDTLKNGWITTGPKTKQFEADLAKYCGTKKVACLNSATAAGELILRLIGIGKGDEVIIPAYTFTASASIIAHVGATPVIIDSDPNCFLISPKNIARAITPKTKAIICVDIAGIPCNYDEIYDILKSTQPTFTPSNNIQQALGRIAIISDAAHSLGAKYHNKYSGSLADFTFFSFHAVKNLTTAEGGAVTWNAIDGVPDQDIYNEFMLMSLHGQNKSALDKLKAYSWEYDIKTLGYKCNMTDIAASLGLSQLRRYNLILKKRREIAKIYDEALADCNLMLPVHENNSYTSSFHLYMLRILSVADEVSRAKIIERMFDKGIATNVHYKPLPMLTAYKKLGFNITDYPNAYKLYQNEVTLPLHTKLCEQDAIFIAQAFKDIII